MKKFFLLFIALILGIDLSAQRQELFVTTADSAHPYRIPAIAHLKGKRLLSVTDYRLVVPTSVLVALIFTGVYHRITAVHGPRSTPLFEVRA